MKSQPAAMQANYRRLAKIVRALTEQGGHQLLLLGPVRIGIDPHFQQGDKAYCLTAITPDVSGADCCYDSAIYLGLVAREYELREGETLVIRHDRELELAEDEAEELRHELIRQCRRQFKQVRTFDSEYALADATVAIFPGAKSRELRDEVYG